MNSFALQSPAYRWAIAFGVGSGLAGPQAEAAPQGLAVTTGAARVVVAGLRTEVSVSDRALLQWNQFNVAAKESVIFKQPSSSSVVWNQIAAGNPSQIFGRIEANGIVVLANPSGFWFGPSSFVQAASFVATTALAPPPSFDTSGAWSSQLAPPSAGIVNYGQIEARPGGSVYLLAQQVENHGTVSAPQGTVGLQAGQEVLISERADGRGLSTKVKLPAGIVDNLGHLTAAAGRILLEARVVNQAGMVEANSVRGQAGSIELLAEDTVVLAEGSKTVAQGDGLGASPGGHILIRSERLYLDSAGAQVNVAGGGAGGNGGDIEISASELPAITAQVGGQAVSGSSAGRLLIDPDNIVVDSTGVSTSPSGTVNAGQSPTRLVVQPDAFAAFSKILLQARKTIDINSLWNLPDTAGESASLTLESGSDLRIGANGGVSAGAGWAVTLRAGSLLNGTDEVVRGVGSILFNGGSSISAQDGSIHLSAGKDVTVQRGFVRTTAGGEISVRAVGGTITTGTKPDGFQFRTGDVGYDVSPGLGGLSTAAGGDVKLIAGKDVISYLPILMGNHTDGGSGAFGEAPGDVSIQAGGGVYGHFVVRHGQGKIVAEGSAGVANRQLALSLVQGSWTVSALDIALQEVRNPNGVFTTQSVIYTTLGM